MATSSNHHGLPHHVIARTSRGLSHLYTKSGEKEGRKERQEKGSNFSIFTAFTHTFTCSGQGQWGHLQNMPSALSVKRLKWKTIADINVCACACACACAYGCACICAGMHMYIYVYMYICIYMHLFTSISEQLIPPKV